MASRKFLEASVDRCPQTQCGGKLVLTGSANTNFSGYTCGNRAIFKCSDCGIRLELTNPNSFTTYACGGCGIKLGRIVKRADYDWVSYDMSGKEHNCKIPVKRGGWVKHPKMREFS